MMVCEIYAVVTLSITTVWVYFAKDYSIRTLALIMFFPGLFAPWFAEDPNFFYSMLGIGKIKKALIYSVVAAVCVIVTIALVATVDLLTGWGRRTTESRPVKAPGGSADNLSGFLRAAGEEIGWRCYLLPCLMTYYRPGQALTYSGVVWAMFHIPVMVLLTGRIGVRDRWKTVIAQFLSTTVNAIVIGWISIKSDYSVWPPTVHHFLWNRWVPMAFGSIYTQEKGRLFSGQQWLINPEGIAGVLAGLVMSVGVAWDLRNFGLELRQHDHNFV